MIVLLLCVSDVVYCVSCCAVLWRAVSCCVAPWVGVGPAGPLSHVAFVSPQRGKTLRLTAAVDVERRAFFRGDMLTVRSDGHKTRVCQQPVSCLGIHKRHASCTRYTMDMEGGRPPSSKET